MADTISEDHTSLFLNGQKRRRSKVACEPCRERKRKCNGAQPCATCTRYEYVCYYEHQSRKSKKKAHALPDLSSDPAAITPDSPDQGVGEAPSPSGRIRSAEANSGSAFVRRLGLRLDPANAPNLRLFSWNVGRHSVLTDNTVLPLMDIVSQKSLKTLALIYFEKFNSLYGIIDKADFFRRLDERWLDPSPSTRYDAVLCCVGAMGYLFSHRRATAEERRLVETARLIIDANSSAGPPAVDIVAALAVRVAYLRITDKPYVAWMASCSLMHMIEETSLHLEPPAQSILSQAADSGSCDPDTRRRLYGISQHLHVWMAFDLGRSRVKLQGASNVLPLPKPGDYTTEVLSLLPFSESLDPDESKEGAELEVAMSTVLGKVYLHPAAILAQCNVALCMYRRLRASNWSISNENLKLLFRMIDHALVAVRDLVASSAPWHGISNVSFQIICSLLAIDNADSIAHLDEALSTLHEVVTAYDTDVMREAYATASMLVMLYYQKKKHDVNSLGQSVRQHCMVALDDSDIPLNDINYSQPQWLDNIVSDVPALQDLDFDEFLSSEMFWGLPMLPLDR